MNDLQQEQSTSRVPSAFLAGLLVMGVLIALVWLVSGKVTKQSGPAPLAFGEAEKAYAPRIVFKNIQMSRAENFLKQEVTVVGGTIENKGNMDVVQMTFAVEFRDFEGQVVLREEVRYPDSKLPRIPASGERDFVLNFEKVPTSWSQQYPQFVITGLALER